MKNKNLQIQSGENRRQFLFRGGMLLAGASVAGLTLFSTSCDNDKSHVNGMDDDELEEDNLISPNEDLMREHGLLQRMMLIYDFGIDLLNNDRTFDPRFIHQTATIIQDFIENYHEKLEEEFVFPRMKNAGVQTELVDVLLQQHDEGRKITEIILSLTKLEALPTGDALVNLLGGLKAFTSMYRHHEAWEETVLFPAFKKVLSANEYAALGEDFEEREHEKFGQDGFESMVDKVATIEKQMGIYDLSLFTPVI